MNFPDELWVSKLIAMRRPANPNDGIQCWVYLTKFEGSDEPRYIHESKVTELEKERDCWKK